MRKIIVLVFANFIPSLPGNAGESEKDMKLKDVDWSALLFSDRGLLPKDLSLMTQEQCDALMELEVEKIRGKRYKVIEKRLPQSHWL